MITTLVNELPPTARAGFELAAFDQGNTLISNGAAVEIQRVNLENITDIKEARITICVSLQWEQEVQAQGGTIQILRVADDGSRQALQTQFVGVDTQGRRCYEGFSPQGLSIFALVAVAPKPAAFSVTSLALDPQVAEPKEAVAITAQVVNQGGQAGTLGILLRVNGKPLDTLEITLGPGEKGDVVFFLRQAEEGKYQIQVEQQTAYLQVVKKLPPALISYQSLSVSPKQAAPNQPVTVTVQINNSGDMAGNLDLQMFLNDALYLVKPTRLPGNITAPVSYTIAPEFPGSYRVTVGGLSDSFTVTKPMANAAIGISKLDVRPANVKAGERVTVVAAVANTGDLPDTFAVVLLINGKQEAKETVTLEGKATSLAIFDVTKNEPGTYTVQVEILKGSFTVLRVPGAAFTISDLQVSPQTSQAGQAVTITVKVSNNGDAAGSKTVTLKINGTAEATKEVSIAAGAAQTVSFTVTRDRGGNYNVDVDGQTGSFEVAGVAGAPIGLIIGIVSAVLIMAGVAVYFLVPRRRPPVGSVP